MISYYGYIGSWLCDINDDNTWDVGEFGGVRNTTEVQGSGWGFGDKMIQLYWGIRESLELKTSSCWQQQPATFSYLRWEDLGYKAFYRPVSCLLLGIDRGQCKLITGVPGRRSWFGVSVGFLAPVGMWDGWEKIDEYTEARGVGGRWMRARRGDLGYHELMTAPKYCGKWLVHENKWWRVKQPYQKKIFNKRSSDWKNS